MRLHRLTLPTAAVAALTATLMTPVVAMADPHPSHPGLVSADPANSTPDVLDGHVNSFAQAGDTMFVGGDFSQVEQGGTTYDRDNLFAFSVSSGQVLDSFAATANGEVFDLQLTPDEQSLIVAGAFFKLNNTAHTNRIAEVDAATGALVAGFVSPEPNGLIRDVVAAHGHYYIGGAFTEVGGEPRDYLAALNPDGSDSGAAGLDFDGVNTSGVTNVRSIDVSPDGSKLVVAGNFATIDGHARGQLALLDLTDDDTTLSAWSTQRFAPPCGPHFDAYMRDVAFAPSGDFFVVVNTGGPKGIQKSGLLCDTASRWDVTTTPNAQPAWVNYTGGDTLTAAIVDENAVYVGGHNRWLNNSFGRNLAGPGAVAREGVAALDPQNGLPLSWDPGRRRGYGVYGFALTADGLWVGSDTVGFGGELRNRIAFCPAAGGAALPPYETATLPGHLGLLSSSKITVRTFDGQAAGPAGSVGTPQGWADVRGAFVVDGILYSGWATSTMTAQTFDGTTLGAASEVDLAGGFRDLDSVQAMFFDRVLHRVYYTLEGRNRLYYRYFQPQTQIVGAWRYEAPATAALNWKQVSDAFVIKKRIYVTDSSTKNLRRASWAAATGTVSGPVADLLGPDIDGNSYRAAALVALP